MPSPWRPRRPQPGPPTRDFWCSPFVHEAVRETDRDLWPLVNRMVANALVPELRVAGRLDLVDPARIEEQIGVLGFSLPLEPDQRAELVARLNANLVVFGRIERLGGQIRLSATLAAPQDGASLQLDVAEPRLLKATRALALRVRDTLWGGPPSFFDDERLRQLLVTKTSSARALYDVHSYLTDQQREALLDGVLAQEPGAYGALWARYLDGPTTGENRRALAAATDQLTDPQLQAFFSAIGADEIDAQVCDGVDAEALGRRYPALLGPLAPAVCAQLAGDWERALRFLWQAHGDVGLRMLSRRLLQHQLFLSRSCADQLAAQERVQRLSPESVYGWAMLAHWYARCEFGEQARHFLRVARVLLGDDPRLRGRTALQGAWIHLLDFDVDGARSWLEMVERNAPAEDDNSAVFSLTALALHMQGRSLAAVARSREGLEAFRDGDRNRFDSQAVSAFFPLLRLNAFAEAREVLAEVRERVGASDAVPDRHFLAVFELALAKAEGRADVAALEAETERLGAELEAELGDLGLMEREALACMLYTYTGDAKRAVALSRSARTTSLHLAGCRLRDAEDLLSHGRYAEAAALFHKSVRTIAFGRATYGDLMAEGLLGYARALEGAGRTDDARKILERIAANYARAERLLPAVASAREELAHLGR